MINSQKYWLILKNISNDFFCLENDDLKYVILLIWCKFGQDRFCGLDVIVLVTDSLQTFRKHVDIFKNLLMGFGKP